MIVGRVHTKEVDYVNMHKYFTEKVEDYFNFDVISGFMLDANLVYEKTFLNSLDFDDITSLFMCFVFEEHYDKEWSELSKDTSFIKNDVLDIGFNSHQNTLYLVMKDFSGGSSFVMYYGELDCLANKVYNVPK